MSTLAPAEDVLVQKQRAFLLHQIAQAPDGTLTQSAANKGIVKQIQKELQLSAKTANDIRGNLVTTGLLSGTKVKQVVIYSITEEGKRSLKELDRYLPLLPAGGITHSSQDEMYEVIRDVYILNALDKAPSQTISKEDLELGFGGKGKPKIAQLIKQQPHLALFRDQSCLGLNPATTRSVLSALALRGDILVHRTVNSESYSLTQNGAELLRRLRSQCPILPPTGKPTTAPNDSVNEGRKAFILLKLLQSAKYALWGSDSALGSYPKNLKLNHATAWQVRKDLASQGHISVEWDGKEGCYILTPSGKRYLTTLMFDALGELKIKGSALTELLAAAREDAKYIDRAQTRTDSLSEQVKLTNEQLESTVMEIFHELHRERFANIDMVPIHEIRREVAVRFGQANSTHAVLDGVILSLRREKKLRLISISDRSRATSEQLQDSIVAVGETFFYAELDHAHAQIG